MTGPISAQDLAGLVQGGLVDTGLPGNKVLICDLRAAAAFTAAHIPGAHHLPEHQAIRWVPQRAHTQGLVVLIDDEGQVGGLARHVAAELAHKWFRRVTVLAGGFAAWRAAGLPTEQGGPVGDAAASFDGTQAKFLASGTVAWKAPDPSQSPKKIAMKR